MTTIDRPKQLWNTMPGWGIYADLTPPELTASRKVRTVRKIIAAGLLLLVILLGAGYAYGYLQKESAQKSLDSQQSRTVQLQREQAKYGGVVQIQGAITSVQGQIGSLMGSDVEFDTLVGNIRAQLPTDMTISQLAVTVNNSPAAGSSPTGASTLDASGSLHIGSVTISGTGKTLGDVSVFVDRLRTVSGVVEPFPTSNQTGTGGVTFSVSLTLSNSLLTHKYTAAQGGSK